MRLVDMAYRLSLACAVVFGSVLAVQGGEPTDSDKKPAVIVVKLPADAELYFDDFKCKTSGAVRESETPPLAAGKKFGYRVRGVWTDKGKEVARETRAVIRAGETIQVDLLDLPMPEPKLLKVPLKKIPSVEKKPEPKKEPTTEKKPLPEKKPQPKSVPTPEKKPEPKKEPTPEKKPMPMPEKKPEPETKPKPKKEPTPEKKPEPKKEPTPEKKPESKKEPTPEKKPESKKKPEPKKEPTPPGPVSHPSLRLGMPERMTLQPGQAKLLPITVRRTDFEGPVSVKFDALPPGVTIKNVTIAAGKDKGYSEASATKSAVGQEVDVTVTGSAGRVRQSSVLKVKIAK